MEKSKRILDADIWIDKLRNIINDETTSDAYADYCLHLIGEIECEVCEQKLTEGE